MPRARTVTIVAAAPAGTAPYQLGRPLDADLHFLSGPAGRTIFLGNSKPRKISEQASEHLSHTVDDSFQLKANAKAWGIASASVSNGTAKRYAYYRAVQRSYILETDHTAEMKPPPSRGVFYLHKIHYGRMYEVILKSDKRHFNVGLGAKFVRYSGDLNMFKKSHEAHLTIRAKGLQAKRGAMFKGKTVERFEDHYIDDPRQKKQPILVEYRSIPGAQIPQAWSYATKAQPIASRLRIKAVEVWIKPRKADGRAWDAMGDPCDPALHLFVNGTQVHKCRRVKNTLHARCEPDKALVLQPNSKFQVVAMDQDALAHDRIGTATLDRVSGAGEFKLRAAGQLIKATALFVAVR